VLGDPTTENCIGPAQHPNALTPACTPGAVERPWSVSIEPMAARIHGSMS
jgi:hypothetical protein